SEVHGEGQTLVAQAWDKTNVLGRIDLTIHPITRRVIRAHGRLLPVHSDQLAKAPDIEAILNRYGPTIEAEMGQVHGRATADLRRLYGRRSSALGNFITD